MMRKQLDVTKLFSLGWRPTMALSAGIQKEYDWFLEFFEKKIYL
jgi:nucleoside-diphosphate-sugar epimerase